MAVEIRTATVSDIDELSRLFDGYRMFYEQPSDVELARSFLRARIENDESKIFIAVTDDGKGRGFTQLFPSFSSVAARRLWILNDLYVDASARRKGVGRRLMNAARDFAVDTGAKGLVLETGVANTSAQALYKDLGYQKNTAAFYFFLSLD